MKRLGPGKLACGRPLRRFPTLSGTLKWCTFSLWPAAPSRTCMRVYPSNSRAHLCLPIRHGKLPDTSHHHHGPTRCIYSKSMGIGVCGLHKHNPLVWCMRVSMVGEAVGAPVCGVGRASCVVGRTRTLARVAHWRPRQRLVAKLGHVSLLPEIYLAIYLSR